MTRITNTSTLPIAWRMARCSNWHCWRQQAGAFPQTDSRAIRMLYHFPYPRLLGHAGLRNPDCLRLPRNARTRGQGDASPISKLTKTFQI